jgi:integrase
MRPIPFARFFDMIDVIYRSPGHAPRTAAKMRHILDLIGRMGVRTTAELTTELVAKFVTERSKIVNPNTVRGDLSYLSAACSLAVEEGWLERPPRFKRLRPQPVRSKMPKCHSIEEVARVLEYLRQRSESWKGHRLYALAATVAYTGLRRDEALTLQEEDVNLVMGLLTVSDRERRKTEKSIAVVPIPPELSEILLSWLPRCQSEFLFPGIRNQGPWTGGACGERACDRVRQAGLEVGVPGFTLLSLRHTFATHARRAWGLSDIELATILRHSSPATQTWYVHEDPDPCAIVRVVGKVSYRL